jgi:hypothetical protein
MTPEQELEVLQLVNRLTDVVATQGRRISALETVVEQQRTELNQVRGLDGSHTFGTMPLGAWMMHINHWVGQLRAALEEEREEERRMLLGNLMDRTPSRGADLDADGVPIEPSSDPVPRRRGRPIDLEGPSS